jgi:hypothetical protein
LQIDVKTNLSKVAAAIGGHNQMMASELAPAVQHPPWIDDNQLQPLLFGESPCRLLGQCFRDVVPELQLKQKKILFLRERRRAN